MKNKTYEEIYGEEIGKEQRINKSKKMTEKCHNGEIIPNFKKARYGWYQRIWCDSSWELAWIVYNLDHEIEFERNRKRFPYTYDDEKHNWVPDFKIGDTYIEIKGQITKCDLAKWEYFPESLTVIGPKEIQPYLNYVTGKYGKDFTRLYE